MSLLLYCITASDAPVNPPSTGVRGTTVSSTQLSGLRCFYSAIETLTGSADHIKTDALDFHRVTRQLFHTTTIIPFRFPTTLTSVAELDAYLRAHATQYDVALRDFRDKVQMDLRITLAESEKTTDAPTGTKYLTDRAQHTRQVDQAIAACRRAVKEEVIDWRQRESSHGVRCFALIQRDAVARFQQQIKQVRLHEAVTASLSGPWPPTEFLPDFA